MDKNEINALVNYYKRFGKHEVVTREIGWQSPLLFGYRLLLLKTERTLVMWGPTEVVNYSGCVIRKR